MQQPERYHLATLLADEPIVLEDPNGQDWQPRNADNQFRGEVRLLECIDVFA